MTKLMICVSSQRFSKEMRCPNAKKSNQEDEKIKYKNENKNKNGKSNLIRQYYIQITCSLLGLP